MEKELVVPAEYGCLALLALDTYEGFVDEDWGLTQIKQHIASQSQQGRIVAWGCVPGNWIIRLSVGSAPAEKEPCFESAIRSNGQLLITTYDSLTVVAEDKEESLPEDHEIENVLAIPPGDYTVRVSQTFAHRDRESKLVFDQTEPHYYVTLNLISERAQGLDYIPWFPDGSQIA